jgi:hypothetical protein
MYGFWLNGQTKLSNFGGNLEMEMFIVNLNTVFQSGFSNDFHKGFVEKHVLVGFNHNSRNNEDFKFHHGSTIRLLYAEISVKL